MEKSIVSPEYGVLLDLLRQRRAKTGLTQVELAKRIGETQSRVSKIERGELRLDVIQLRSICSAMGIDWIKFLRTFESKLEKPR
ncbi:helix-turn-helix transcriptional regulator [Novipirellula rosea]|uniref:helix-turn-helix domain-containing protein n=1 Tax=Novipirellula rosea TaxID=1031540 RepID=UPI0031F0ED40